LSIGIQLELNAIEFYRAQSSITQNEQVKKFYSELADWEVGHYQILLKQHDYLKEDYWHSAGFAPF
jgi:rubrerythrin